MKYLLSIILLSAFFHSNIFAQPEKRWLHHEISLLAANNMFGRGYVNGGKEKAAKHIIRRFKQMGLRPVTPDSSYTQDYYFAVNTFPDIVYLGINKKELAPGADYLVDASSHSFKKWRMKIRTINFDKIKDSADWSRTEQKLKPQKFTYFFEHTDSFFKHTGNHPWHFSKELPKGCYIMPEHGKMFWTVSGKQMPATVLYVEDTVLPKKFRRASVNVHAEFIPEYKGLNQNIIACVPGEVKDSFVVFTAHYDHLGMMGDAIFPGASDNASGTAMMLYLANYFAQHPQHYTMVFMAFSGEEAGLLGSEYFVKHPLIPLSNIKFLTNLDIMGDAMNGITVVNATQFPKQFELLQEINKKNNYLPEIKSRGKAANSDHYHFSENGVPAFFFYSNGGPGYYHDIFDNAASLPLTNIDKAAKLFIAFGEALNKTPTP